MDAMVDGFFPIGESWLSMVDLTVSEDSGRQVTAYWLLIRTLQQKLGHLAVIIQFSDKAWCRCRSILFGSCFIALLWVACQAIRDFSRKYLLPNNWVITFNDLSIELSMIMMMMIMSWAKIVEQLLSVVRKRIEDVARNYDSCAQ